MTARVGALLAILGFTGILVIAYLLCSQHVRPDMDALLGGQVNLLGVAIVTSLVADVFGAVLLAWGTRPGRDQTGEDDLYVSGRPGWATLVLVLAVLVPSSVALWFGLLCNLVG